MPESLDQLEDSRDLRKEERAMALPTGVIGRSCNPAVLFCRVLCPLLTHHAIAVPVIHVNVCGMTGVDGGNAMAARFRAGDAPVAVVVIELEGIASSRTRGDRDRRRNRSRAEVVDVQRRRCTPGQDAFQHVSLTRVDGEGIALAHLDHATREPAVVEVWEPFRCVLRALLGAVDRGARQGQVEQVAGKLTPGGGVRCAQAAVMGLRAGNDVLDVGLGGAGEPGACVWSVDDTPHAGDDTLLHGLGIGVVVGVIWRTTILGGNHKAAPCTGASRDVADRDVVCRRWLDEKLSGQGFTVRHFGRNGSGSLCGCARGICGGGWRRDLARSREGHDEQDRESEGQSAVQPFAHGPASNSA